MLTAEGYVSPDGGDSVRGSGWHEDAAGTVLLRWCWWRLADVTWAGAQGGMAAADEGDGGRSV